MIASQRNLYILRRLDECGIIDYKSISRELGVSEATVRRDFEKLEQSGKLRRVQGGAMRSDEMAVELSSRAKNSLHADRKTIVAEAAAAEVQDGEDVFLDMGTSIAPLGRLLLQRPVRIITTNNLILQSVTPASRAEVYVIGGHFSPVDHMFIGSSAEQMLQNFTFHRAFIGCMGIDPKKNAVYVTDISTCRIKQIAMANAQQRVLLVDRSKMKKVGLLRLCGVSDFDRVYMDGPVPGECGDNFVEVIKE